MFSRSLTLEPTDGSGSSRNIAPTLTAGQTRRIKFGAALCEILRTAPSSLCSLKWGPAIARSVVAELMPTLVGPTRGLFADDSVPGTVQGRNSIGQKRHKEGNTGCKVGLSEISVGVKLQTCRFFPTRMFQ
jgi:hypothetical protein